MYNRLYKDFSDSIILYKKHLTEHAIIQLVDQVNCSFERKSGRARYFFLQAFDTVSHKSLITKLETIMELKEPIYDCEKAIQKIVNNSLDMNISCYINISCGVPPGSILGPLLFLLYLNDLNKRLIL